MKGIFKSVLFETQNGKAAKDSKIGVLLNKKFYYWGEEVEVKIKLNNKMCSYSINAIEV